jgi:hypothetical protein
LKIELEKINDKLEKGGLSVSEERDLRNRKRFIWSRIRRRETGDITEPPRYATRSQTTPDVIIQFPPLPHLPIIPTGETDSSNSNNVKSVSLDFPK